MISFLTFIASLIYSTNFLLFIIISILLIIFVILPIIFVYLRRKFTRQRLKNNREQLQIGIFHPYCNAGGGGEKVLWVAIQALQKQYKNAQFAIYTGDIEATPIEILNKTETNLNVKLECNNIKFIYLTKRKWIESEQYPYFTLLGQAIGSIYLAYEALNKYVPDIYFETTGLTFTLPLFKYFGNCKIGCYVHYPIITNDMIQRVTQRQTLYNNRNVIARNPLFTYTKLLYYRLFAWLYYLVGKCSDITLVNSTFTLEHLQLLWQQRNLHLIYPPCDVDDLKLIERKTERPKQIRILSISQFRPEKDHPLQLQTLYELREILPNRYDFDNIKLILCGSCRNQNDYERVKDLKDLSKHLNLENNVEFKLNLNYNDLLLEYQKAYIGIHTMLDEHFGIGVVELMAAGLIVLAHCSGGPLLDIIETQQGSRLGYLATTPDEYAMIIKYLLLLEDIDEINEIRERARASVDRFSLKKFQQEFLRAVQPLFK